jgi:two-component system sensor histidine kinase PilS (NtrC family)
MHVTELRRQLIWLIGIRAIISTLLLGWAVLVQFSAPGLVPRDPFFFLIGLAFGLTVLWTVTLRWVDRHTWLVDLQIACDVLIIAAFISVTGGIVSYFSLLLVLPIVAAGAMQRRRGGLMVAVLGTAVYGAIVLAQYQGVIQLPGVGGGGAASVALPTHRMALYTVATNVFAFFAVAALSGSMSEGLRRAGARLERASSELADLQVFSQDIIDSLTSGLITTDFSGSITTFNRAAEGITGHTAAAVTGRPVAEVLQLPPDLAAALTVDLGGERSRRADYPYTTADCRPIEIGLSATHLVTTAGRKGFIFAFQDVTEIKRLERDARMKLRLAAVGEMAAGIAHEIRNPLASMSGSIQVLRHELPLSSEQTQLMDIVLRESERLNDIIRSFLAYARPQRFAISRVDVRQAVSDTAVLLRNSALVRENHVIDVEVPPSSVWLEADEGQIRQVIWNLATNGLRAMPSGGCLRLGVAAAPPSGNGARLAGGDVRFWVQDEGVGIPSDELDHLFQPFFGTFAKGTGLGLAIVHRIVSDYNGDVQATSAPGAGTTFEVRLPARAGTRGA